MLSHPAQALVATNGNQKLLAGFMTVRFSLQRRPPKIAALTVLIALMIRNPISIQFSSACPMFDNTVENPSAKPFSRSVFFVGFHPDVRRKGGRLKTAVFLTKAAVLCRNISKSQFKPIF